MTNMSDKNEETVFCSNCGASLSREHAFCPQCGTPKNISIKEKCVRCGADIPAGEAFCSNCGQRAEDGALHGQSTNLSNQTGKNAYCASAGKKNIGIVIVAVAVIIALALTIGFLGKNGESPSEHGPSFKKIYDEYCSSIWASVGSDGSYLSIDTNPYDEEDNGIAYYAAYIAIKEVNEALGLPESLAEDMGHTASKDGKQSETFEKQGVIVTWKYHPDQGLEVTYKKIN